MHHVSAVSRDDSSEALNTQLSQRQQLWLHHGDMVSQAWQTMPSMPDSKPKLTAPVGCAEEDVVRQAWQVVQVDCIPRIDAHGAPRHAQAEVHPLHGAGLDQLEAVHLASLQSKSSESASSSEAVAGQADKGGPVSLQPGRALHLLCFSSHCSLHGALCGVSDSHAGRGLCLRQAC